MYETLMHTLRGFFGSGAMRTCLIVAISSSVAVLAAYMSPAFRALVARMKERGGWRNILATVGTGMFKFLLLFVLIRLFVSALGFQANIF